MRNGYGLLIFLAASSLAFAQGISVTFKVNTATHPGGVTDSTHTMTVRGSFNGWSATTEGTLVNGGGDFWSVTVALSDTFTTSHSINYKFVSDDGAGVSWEDAISDRSLALTAGGTIDAGLAYWDQTTDLYTATDSIDVWFRINMGGEAAFDADLDTVLVAGGDAPLTWDASSVELIREGTTDFYSALASFSNDSSGQTAEYKFIYNRAGITWESVDNRTHILGADTTLAWKWFSDTPKPAAVDTFKVTFIVNTATVDNFTDSTTIGFVSGSFDGWTDHQGDTLTTMGDYSSISLDVIGDAAGVDITYKFLYEDITAVNWEDDPNRDITVSSDTTISNWWNRVEPFTATDSIDVWFRVNMEGDLDFDSSAATVYAAGGIPPLQWGNTSIMLTREGSSWYYSGLVSFHNDSAGVTVPYKFIYDQGGIHWEDVAGGGDRTFMLGVDTTIAFKYFSDTPPTTEVPITANVVFSVDVGAYKEMEIFSVAGNDTMQVRGGFNGWASTALPDQSDLVLERISGTDIFFKSIAITKFVATTDEYKFYIKFSSADSAAFVAENPYWFADMGYENPAKTGGGNRSYTFVGDENTPQELPVAYYNGIPPDALIPSGTTTSLTFTADMRYAATADPQLFFPGADSVWWVPKDEWAAHVLGYIRDSEQVERRSALKMTPTTANDSIFTITFDWVGPIPWSLVYVYEWGSTANDYAQEGGGFAAGRFRSRYIPPVSVSTTAVTWPTAYNVPVDTAGVDPPLVVEDEPSLALAVDDLATVPTAFRVAQNYPNPFNPSTTINFVLPAAETVTFTVYNILGQKVASLTQDFPGPGAYSFKWHGLTGRGRPSASGIYFYQVKTSTESVIRKMTLLR